MPFEQSVSRCRNCIAINQTDYMFHSYMSTSARAADVELLILMVVAVVAVSLPSLPGRAQGVHVIMGKMNELLGALNTDLQTIVKGQLHCALGRFFDPVRLGEEKTDL